MMSAETTKTNQLDADRDTLRAEIARRGFSVADVARRMGVSRQYLWRLLSGRQPITLAALDRIVTALEPGTDARARLLSALTPPPASEQEQ